MSATLLCLASGLSAGEAVLNPSKTPGPLVKPASNEGTLAIKKFKVAPGLQTELWAAEPDVANIVSFAFDDQGACYVVETFRHSDGVTDIRGHMDWLDEELASRSVEERVSLMTRHEGAKISNYTNQTDRVRKVWDSGGTGRADRSTVFSTGYNDVADGLAAGVLPWGGNVYFANIPHLWKLNDKDGDGIADTRQSLAYGFGVRAGFLGHDLHGLIVGPDGRIYFSVGDRGAYVNTREGRVLATPETGAVFRCNPDGSGLEIFASGLRNPQELAFDDHGNLFTGDNNSDGGDPARWVYLVEGGDSGWRIGYQFLEQPNSRGPWNAESMCRPTGAGPHQPSYIIPPVANIANGPSGLAFDPGTGLPDAYRGRFYLCDFTGGQGSKVHTFRMKPKGAGFEMTDRDVLISDLLCTDVGFGPDGGIYVSDWVAGWDKTGKGRIYRLSDPAATKDPARIRTQKLIAILGANQPASELESLLSHPDQRVRLRAQFGLVAQNGGGDSALRKAASHDTNRLARIHAIWGIEQRMRALAASGAGGARSRLASTLLNGLRDRDAEVRAQCAKALGEAQWTAAKPALVALLADAEPRTRFLAASALGKLKDPSTATAFVQLARDNATARDPYIRHAAVIGLAALRDATMLSGFHSDASVEVRLTALLALRRLEAPEISAFLSDSDPELVLEAARAISDLPINPALPELAALAGRTGLSEPLWRRVLNANFRLGTLENAVSVLRTAQGLNVPAGIRTEALQCLGSWSTPSGRDRVTGLWRPVAPRVAGLASGVAGAALPDLIRSSPTPVQVEAVRLASLWKQAGAGEALLALVRDPKGGAARVPALAAISRLQLPQAEAAMESALKDADEPLRNQATKLQGERGGQDVLGSLKRRLESGTRGEQQAALAALGTLPDAGANAVLAASLDRLLAGSLQPELHLDLLEAAAKRKDGAITDRLKRYEAARKPADGIGAYRECLSGGDAEAGRKVFRERAEVSCIRCHKVGDEGGEAGPNLTEIGKRSPREYILESIVSPNIRIAPGFESILVTLKDGSSYAGTLKHEDGDTLELNSPEDGPLKLKKANIVSRERGLSSMPEELRLLLTKQDLRNLVEFLAGSHK